MLKNQITRQITISLSISRLNVKNQALGVRQRSDVVILFDKRKAYKRTIVKYWNGFVKS